MMEFGLIGEHLGHSFSKEIHGKLSDRPYELREIPRDGLAKFLTGREFRGINVTIPYKETVIPGLDFVSPEARKIGAVNTIVNRDGRLYGYNEILYSCETYQFRDYSKYDMNLFSEEQRREHREKQFPIDLKNAFDLGKRLAERSAQA